MTKKALKQVLSKSILGIAGEYFVAAELGRRNIYAQVTMGSQKRTDLLVTSSSSDKQLKIEVKSKNGKTWPNCKGINSENSIIVFVNFQNIEATERPNYYILNNKEWSDLVVSKHNMYNTKNPPTRTEIVNNTLRFLDQIKNDGKHYEGCDIGVSDVIQHTDRWDKIIERLL